MSINVNSNIISSTGFNTSGDILNSPSVITDGLTLWLDAGNNASYMNSSSYYDCGYGCQYYASDPGCTNCNTQIKDMSGYGNDGTFVNSTTVGYDNTGGYLNFNGSDKYVVTNGTPSSLQGNPNLTVSGFFRRKGDTIQKGVWGIGGNVSNEGICSWNYNNTNEIEMFKKHAHNLKNLRNKIFFNIETRA